MVKIGSATGDMFRGTRVECHGDTDAWSRRFFYCVWRRPHGGVGVQILHSSIERNIVDALWGMVALLGCKQPCSVAAIGVSTTATEIKELFGCLQ